MIAPILTLQDIHLSFGGTPLFEGAEIKIETDARICLVGRNGSGKSTFLKIISGRVEPDTGTRFVQPGLTMGTLDQNPDLGGYDTVSDYLEQENPFPVNADALARYSDALKIDMRALPGTLSGGEARKVALAKVLIEKPDLLLLDEPTNHLDLPSILWLEDELARYKGALVMISHDRQFLNRLSRQTVWIDRGQTRVLEKNFSAFEDWRDQYLENEALEQHKLTRKIVREQHWIVHGVSGRRKRNMRRVKALAALRTQKQDFVKPTGAANLHASGGQMSGKTVVEFTRVNKSYGQKSLIQNLSLRIHRGERIGIIGPNGAGKSTLLKLITGDIPPDSGLIKHGTNLQTLYIDQNRSGLDPETSLKDALTGGGTDMVMVGETQKHVISYMKDFLFLPEQARTPLSRLSGGERARVELARGLAKPSNLLILDEPTNDLDLETLDLLQEMIAEYKGTVLLVSHDRDFLDKTVARIVSFAGQGEWVQYAGGYSDMLRQMKQKPTSAKTNPSSSKKPRTNIPQNRPSKPKLSYKHKYRLEILPSLIETLETEIAELRQHLEEPNLYTKDPDFFTKTAAALQRAENELTQLEDEWLELEAQNEGLN